MGPYYRGTSQGMGEFFDMFYQHPLLMLFLVLIGVSTAAFFWWRSKSGSKSDL